MAHLRIKKLKAIRTPAIAGVVILSSGVMMSKYVYDFTIIAKDVRNAKNDCSLQNATAVRQVYFTIFSLAVAVVLAWNLRKVQERFSMKSHLLKVALWTMCFSMPLDLVFVAYLDMHSYLIICRIGYLVTYGIFHYYCGILPILIANAEKKRNHERHQMPTTAKPNKTIARASSASRSVGGGSSSSSSSVKVVVVTRASSFATSSAFSRRELKYIGSVDDLRQVLMGDHPHDSKSPTDREGVLIGKKAPRKQSDEQQKMTGTRQEKASKSVLLEFQKYLVTEFCVENALFLAEAVRFRELAAEQGPPRGCRQTELIAAAQHICSQFITAGSESEVNVSEILRSEIVERVATAAVKHSQQQSAAAAPSLLQQATAEVVVAAPVSSSDVSAAKMMSGPRLEQDTPSSSPSSAYYNGSPGGGVLTQTAAGLRREQEQDLTLSRRSFCTTSTNCCQQASSWSLTAAEFEAIESEILTMCLPSYNRFVRCMRSSASR